MRSRYGRGPLHLLGHVALFALIGYAIAQVLGSTGAPVGVVVWLVGAVLLHDLILWPMYAGADAAGRRLLGRAVNHVRVPAGLSLLLAVAFFPTVTGAGASTYAGASGREWEGYVLRWLVVTAALFAISAVVFVVRKRRPRSP